MATMLVVKNLILGAVEVAQVVIVCVCETFRYDVFEDKQLL